jgi:hypothetical protein
MTVFARGTLTFKFGFVAQSWKDSIEQLWKHWSQLESRTKQTIEFLSAASEGRCAFSTVATSMVLVAGTSRKDRKLREKRKNAYATFQDLASRGGSSANEDLFFEPFATLVGDRATMRELWVKRSEDVAFRDMNPDCKPLPLPVQYNQTDAKLIHEEMGRSPMPGLPTELRNIANSVRACAKAFRSGRFEDLSQFDCFKQVDKRDVNSEQAMPPTWSGWTAHQFGLEMQRPWAGLLLSGRKTIETRAYDLPPSLLRKRILIIETPKGDSGVSAIGDSINLVDSSARVVGWCIFSSVCTYANKVGFQADEGAHLVGKDSGYGWKDGLTDRMYGWVVDECGRFAEDVAAQCMFKCATRRMRSLFQVTGEDRKTVAKRKVAAPQESGNDCLTRKKRKRF